MAIEDKDTLKARIDDKIKPDVPGGILPADDNVIRTNVVDSNANLAEAATQTFAGAIIVEGSLTAGELITAPASLKVGSNVFNQTGIYMEQSSEIDGSKGTLLRRDYDDSGSLSILSEKRGPTGELVVLDNTGTRFTFPAIAQSQGTAEIGVNGYQTATEFFIYTPLVNLTLTAHIGSFTGTIVSTISDFNSGPVQAVAITAITLGATTTVTAPGHTYITGDDVGFNFITGTIELNEVVSRNMTVSGNDLILNDVDSTLFSAYVSGGEAGGLLVQLPLDNENRVSPSQEYFTEIISDQAFDIDGDVLLAPWNRVIGQTILEVQTGLLSGDTAELSGVDFDPQSPAPAYKEGRLYYNDTTKTLDFFNDISDVTINLPEELPIRVFNDTGLTITNGQAVRINGASGGLPTITLAQADTVDNARCSGIATHDIEDQTTGYITAIGSVSGFDTSSFAAGDLVFVDEAVPGEITNIEQKILSPVGIVLISDVTNGEIFSRPRGLVNITAIGQVALASPGPITQLLSTTPEPVAGYANVEVPAINVTPTFTAASGQFEAKMSPASVGASGFYQANFSVSGGLSSNRVITFSLYINGSPAGLSAKIDMTSNNLDDGSAAFTGSTPVQISDADEVEVYAEIDSTTSTFTYESLVFGITRIGNA